MAGAGGTRAPAPRRAAGSAARLGPALAGAALRAPLRRALPALVLLVALGGAARAQENGLQRAVRLVGERRHAEALEAARADAHPLRRQQAVTYVLDQCGDLAGALAAARAGLEVAPQDLWLLERAVDFAVALHRAELALELAHRWNAAIAASSAPIDELTAQTARAGDAAVEVSRLVRSARRQQRGLARARWTSLLVLAAVLAGLGGLARTEAGEEA